MQVLQHHADKVVRLQPGNWVQFWAHSVLRKDEKNKNAERKINLYSVWSGQRLFSLYEIYEGGKNNSFKPGKGSWKVYIDKFFLHTYPDVSWSPAVKTAVTWSVRNLQSASSGMFVWSG